jgi:hypothetical protein
VRSGRPAMSISTSSIQASVSASKGKPIEAT